MLSAALTLLFSSSTCRRIVVHRPEFLRNGGTPVAIEHHEQQGVQQRLCEKGQQHVLDRRQDFDPVDERPACFGYVHERREVERIPKNADERPRLIAFDVAEEGFPAAAVEEPFARDVIPDVRKAHCGIGMRDEGTGAAEHQVVAVSRMVAAGNAFTEQGKGCGDETDADDLAVFLDGHKLAVGHVPGGPGGERIADFPFSRSHDAGDVAALHLAGFGPQGARNGPVGIDDADHPEAESVRIRFHGRGAFLYGDGRILDQRLLAHAFEQ